ncbi:MAG: hypothetical protein GX454_04130 [Brooklawnia sp.]|nr:hypothetical protein [Brooklawnia sp.]
MTPDSHSAQGDSESPVKARFKFDGPLEMTAYRLGSKSEHRRLSAPDEDLDSDFLGIGWKEFLDELFADTKETKETP